MSEVLEDLDTSVGMCACLHHHRPGQARAVMVKGYPLTDVNTGPG